MEEPVNENPRTVVLEVETPGRAWVVDPLPTEYRHYYSMVLNVPDTISNEDVQIAFNRHKPELGPEVYKDWKELAECLPSHRRPT